MIICFYKIFYSPRAALRKEGPPLTVYLPGAIKYIDHASKLQAQCEAVLDKPGITVQRHRGHHIASTKKSRSLFCVRGGPVHVLSARNREKRLLVCRFQICVILKRQNSIRARQAPISMFALQINSTMQKFRRRGLIQEWKTRGFLTKVTSFEKSTPHNSV